MNVAQFCTGMIFTLPDQNLTDKSGDYQKKLTHPYIVLGIKQRKNGDEGKRYFIQVMGITSLTNKVATDEIPIVMSNSTIGYISTSNIFSYDTESLDMYNFKGMIVDDDFMSKDAFIRFLTDMWRVNNGLAMNDEEKKILDTLNKYKEYFKKENGSIPEFRQVKPETTMSLAISKAEAAVTKENIEPKKVTSPVVNATDNRQNKIPDIKESLKIDKAGYKIQSWTNEEIQLMLDLAKAYTYQELSKYMSRYTKEYSYNQAMKVVRSIAKDRGLLNDNEKDVNHSNNPDNSVKSVKHQNHTQSFDEGIPVKPLPKYSDAELKAVSKYLNKHENDKIACIRYVRCRSEMELTSFMAKLKMEMRRRKLN